MPFQEPPRYAEYFTSVGRLGASALALFRVYRAGVIHDCQVATLCIAIHGDEICVDYIRSMTNAPQEITFDDIMSIFRELTEAGILYYAGYRNSKKRGSLGTRTSVWRLADEDLAKARLATLRNL